jgi:ATP-dependent HslUV protease subunit HslV
MIKGTTIIALLKDGRAAIAGDGQVTFGENTIMKQTAKKVRKIFDDRVLVGFAGSVADALTLTDKFEGKLEQYGGNLKRAAVELAKEWRTDKVLRKLEAMLIAADAEQLLIISGNGDVIEPDDQIAAVGSGGAYALAAAKALYQNTDMSAASIAEKALKIAADICVYTNHNITVLEL